MMLVLMRGSGALRERAAWRDLVVWGVLAAVTYVAFWPAMWVAPAETLGRVLGFVRDNANPSHAAAADEDGSGALFYPLVLLLRSTPLLWLGLLGLVVARPRGLQGRAVLCLLVFALAFGAAMTLAAKNFDRYLLPIFPALNLVAGVGLWGLTVRLCSPLGPASSPNSPERGLAGGGLPLHGVALLALVIGLGAWWIIGAWPYELTYANPLLGGNPTAHRFVASGWGEGLDQAAAYLNARPNAGRLKVALPGEIYTTVLDAQLSGTVAPAEGGNPMGYDALVVYSRNRQLGERAPFFDDSLLTWEPEHVVTLSGVDYAWIYDTRAGAPVGAQFGDRIVLDGYGLVDSSAGAGRRRFQARLRWRPLDVMAPGLQVVIELRPPGGGEPYTLTQQIQRGAVAPSGVGEWAPMSYEIVLPADAPPGSYVLAVRVLGEDGRPLPVTGQPPRPPGVPNEPDAVPVRHLEVR
jgi:hypothetical protein